MALVVRVAAFAIPLLVGVLAAHLATPALARPQGFLGGLAFIAQVAVVSTAAATCTDRFTRRLLPLASLLRMSLVFPDEAPSRFKAALRSGSSKRLEADLRRLRNSRPGDLAHGEAAELLIDMLSQLGRHERLTRGHTERVRAYAELIAQELELSREDQELLRWGVLAHDLGKLAVPAAILNKNGRPTDAEWEILRTHPEVGAELVEPLAGWLGEWRRAASEHHERFDGGGYPLGLRGNEISLAGRIVAVADAYDVMTSTRSYKKPSPPEKARRELVRCAGSQFDPDVVRAMLNVSLGKLRLASGPLGALSELPLLGRVATPVQLVSSGSVTAVAALSAAVMAIAAPQPAPAADEVHAAAFATIVQEATVLAEEGPQRNVDKPTGTPDTASPFTSTVTTSTVTTSTTSLPSLAGAQYATTTTGGGLGGTSAQPGPLGSSPTTTRSAASSDPAPPSPQTSSPAPTYAPPPTTTAGPAGGSPAPPSTAAPPTTQPPSPWLGDDAITVHDDHDDKIFVLDNDTPRNGTIDPSTLTIVSAPVHAKDFRVHDDHLHYRSLKNWFGTDTMTYRVCDTSGACGTATVTIVVTP